jgi:hypothetical protein
MTTKRCICSAGKTNFLKFMLARLISARQVVLLCDNSDTYLFYRGSVHSRPTEPNGFKNIPTRNKGYYPVWTLVDFDPQDREPPLIRSTGVSPVQASSPNPIRFQSWAKKNGAALLRIPVWSVDDLVAGYDFSQLPLSAVDLRRVA